MDYEYDEATDRLVAPSFWTPEAIALFEARHADWVAQRQAVERRMAEIAGPDYEMLPHLGDVRRLATGYLPAEDQGDKLIREWYDWTRAERIGDLQVSYTSGSRTLGYPQYATGIQPGDLADDRLSALYRRGPLAKRLPVESGWHARYLRIEDESLPARALGRTTYWRIKGAVPQ